MADNSGLDGPLDGSGFWFSVPTVSSCGYDGVTRWLKLREFSVCLNFFSEFIRYQFGDGGKTGERRLDKFRVRPVEISGSKKWFWLPPRDSNPDKQIQNLLSYH